MPRLPFSSNHLPPAILLAAIAVAILHQSAFALITGGKGNEPVRDPGWPAGAAAVFNDATRVAWWEGPPFGGGQWHAEYGGDTKEFNALLAGFAKIDVKTKRLVVHDGVGRSFWLNPNREAAKADESQIDWTFTVWQPDSWQRLRKMPASLRPGDLGDGEKGPPVEFEVYTGATIRWEDVIVPQGIDVIDERLEAHGFTFDDMAVLEGNFTDLENKKPLAARMELQLSEPQKQGGYRYTVVSQSTADAKGHWVLKRAPAGRYRIVVLAEGYVPRVIGYSQLDGEPGWHHYNGALSRPTSAAGHVTDDAGKPLADVAVRLDDITSQEESYGSPNEYDTKTDVNGQFHFEQVPKASARIWVSKPGYCRRGLGPTITTPAKDVAVTMSRSGQVHVTVDFAGAKRPKEYMVEITPEGGNVVGSWGGGGNINAENKISFKDVPPGRYFLQGRPNPGSEKETTTPIAIDLKGGATEDVKITAILLPN